MAIRLIEEAPRLLEGEKEPAFVTARRLADEIWAFADPARPSRDVAGHVIGLFGGRGSGKTSVLYTALMCLWEKNNQPPNQPRLVLPSPLRQEPPTLRDFEECLFSPAETRDCDELLFGILNHLDHAYAPEPAATSKEYKAAITETRKHEVHRREISRLLDWSKEMATSTEKLPDELVKNYANAAKTTPKLREAFRDLIKLQTGSTNEPSRRLWIIAIDDVDLQPHRTLELLELIHLFLRHPHVVVLVAADRDLMLHSVMENLKERGMHQTGLAGALIAKYVPYQWNVPVPMPHARLSEIWEDNQFSDSSIRRFWGNDKDLAKRWLEPLLPRTYRGLVALHNRAITLWEEVHAADIRLPLEQIVQDRLGLINRFVDPVVALCAAVDTQRPELNVLHTLLHEPDLFRQVVGQRVRSESQAATENDGYGGYEMDKAVDLGGLVEQMRRVADVLSSQARRPLGKLDVQEYELPMLDRIGPPYLDGRLAGEARALLQGLAKAIVTWRELSGQARAEMRLLAISLNADAYMLAAAIRKRREYAMEQIHHIDLREKSELGEPRDVRRASVIELRHTRDTLRTAIEETDLRARQGQVDLVARMQLPLAAWLGAYLPWQMFVTPQQMRGQGDDAIPIEYAVPKELQRPSDNNRYETLGPDPAVFAPSGSEAILIIDPLIRSNAENLNAFVDVDGKPVATEHKYRLLMKEQRQVIEPDDVVPMLRDIVEFAHQLHQRGVTKMHLGLSMPVELAFFLGRELRAWGRVDLYEFYGDQYQYVFDLNS